MANLDQIAICNPTDTDFEVKKDGEFYYLKKGEETIKPQHLARHMAKHLSDRMLLKDYYEYEAKVKRKKEVVPEPIKMMMTMYDTPERRIALYKILKDRDEVEQIILSYPQFKTRINSDREIIFSSVGDFEVYEDFIKVFEGKEEKIKEPITR